MGLDSFEYGISDNFINFLNKLKQWIELDLQKKTTNVIIITILEIWLAYKSQQTFTVQSKMKAIIFSF